MRGWVGFAIGIFNRSPLVRASVDPSGRTRGIRAWCFHVILPAAKFVIAEGMVEGQTVVPEVSL